MTEVKAARERLIQSDREVEAAREQLRTTLAELEAMRRKLRTMIAGRAGEETAADVKAVYRQLGEIFAEAETALAMGAAQCAQATARPRGCRPRQP